MGRGVRVGRGVGRGGSPPDLLDPPSRHAALHDLYSYLLVTATFVVIMRYKFIIQKLDTSFVRNLHHSWWARVGRGRR